MMYDCPEQRIGERIGGSQTPKIKPKERPNFEALTRQMSVA